MSRNSPLFGAAVLLVDVGAMSSLFAVFRLVETGELSFPALPVWLGCLLGCYGVLCLLLRRPRTQRTLILVCGGFFLAQVLLAFRLYGRFAGNFGLLFSLIAWAASCSHAYSLALKPPAAEAIMTSFEVCVLVLLFSLFYCSIQAVAFSCALPAAVATVAALAALIARRTASGRGKTASFRGAGSVLGAIGGFALGALLLAGAAAGAVKSLGLALWRGALAVLGFLGRCVTALLSWLAALIPESEAGEFLPEASPVAIPDAAAAEERLLDPSAVLYALAGLLALAVLAGLVWVIVRGGGKLRRAAPTAGGAVSRRRVSPGRALRRWLGRLREQVRFHVLRLWRRNTAPGLFVELERHWALRRKGRRVGETCREYLLRLTPEYPEGAAALRTLAEDLDACCFGSGSRLSGREIRALRKKLKNGMQRSAP